MNHMPKAPGIVYWPVDAVHAWDGRIVLALRGDHGLLSRDGGRSWAKRKSVGGFVSDVYLRDRGEFVALSVGRVLVSRDEARSWDTLYRCDEMFLSRVSAVGGKIVVVGGLMGGRGRTAAKSVGVVGRFDGRRTSGSWNTLPQLANVDELAITPRNTVWVAGPAPSKGKWLVGYLTRHGARLRAVEHPCDGLLAWGEDVLVALRSGEVLRMGRKSRRRSWAQLPVDRDEGVVRLFWLPDRTVGIVADQQILKVARDGFARKIVTTPNSCFYSAVPVANGDIVVGHFEGHVERIATGAASVQPQPAKARRRVSRRRGR